MSPDPKDIIVLSDNRDNIVDAAGVASDQVGKTTTSPNYDLVRASLFDSCISPLGRPRMETPEPETLPAAPMTTIARPVGRPPMNTLEKLVSRQSTEYEKVFDSTSNGSATRLNLQRFIDARMKTTETKKRNIKSEVLELADNK